MKHSIFVLAIIFVFTTSSCNNPSEANMFIGKVENLINSNNEDEEEIALGELLTSVRNTDINYGYRVFNITKDKRVMPEDINNELEDQLLVTIFVGDNAPYQEFKWTPKYNGHITRLIMP